MATIYDVDQQELIEKAAEELKKNENIQPPEWAGYVKTGVHKERSPASEDWWYMRSASVLRIIYKQGPVGVAKLRVRYGGKQRRGHKPARFARGSGSIIRKVLQQLEKAGYLKKEDKAAHKGRIISPQGKSFLDKVASSIYKKVGKPKVEVKEVAKPEVKKEAPKVEAKPEPKKEVKAEAPKPEVKEAPKEEKK